MMVTEALYKLMYPIGKYESPTFITENEIRLWIQTIEETPTLVRDVIEGLGIRQLSLQYRPNGWSIAQVIHHMCDSHTNAFIRFKLALTEDTPTIKPYKEGLWANLVDYSPEYLHYTLIMLDAVHAKLTLLLKAMDIHDFHNRSYFHPESHKNFTLGDALSLYDWHCRHHLAHIHQALDFDGKFE
ncbi:MAG: putative metal-dependent hydrolase [Saprospiraceae bacterium]|nr:putative metal-dependent hydrolase [Saprospiraceae bacterium]